MLTTVIGSYPKPSFLKLPDWFNAQGGTDTKHPTEDYNNAIKILSQDKFKFSSQEVFKMNSGMNTILKHVRDLQRQLGTQGTTARITVALTSLAGAIINWEKIQKYNQKLVIQQH